MHRSQRRPGAPPGRSPSRARAPALRSALTPFQEAGRGLPRASSGAAGAEAPGASSPMRTGSRRRSSARAQGHLPTKWARARRRIGSDASRRHRLRGARRQGPRACCGRRVARAPAGRAEGGDPPARDMKRGGRAEDQRQRRRFSFDCGGLDMAPALPPFCACAPLAGAPRLAERWVDQSVDSLSPQGRGSG